MAFIGALCLLLVLTTLAGHLSNRIGIPAVIGQILVGILVGPAVLGWIHLDSMINLFSQIGVIILMFIGGLESNLKLLRKYLRPAIIVAIIGVIFPVVMIGAACLAFSFSPLEAIFIGVVFSATSVSISVEVLRDYKSLDTKEGATILGAAVADDIIGVILLSIMISVMGTAGVKTSGASTSLTLIFAEQLAFFALTYPMEVVMYVYREAFILSLAGVLLGFVAGAWLHYYIMQTLPPDTAMASLTLLWTNLGTSGLMTLLFSIVVMAFMARKINRVDMLGALKSTN